MIFTDCHFVFFYITLIVSHSNLVILWLPVLHSTSKFSISLLNTFGYSWTRSIQVLPFLFSKVVYETNQSEYFLWFQKKSADELSLHKDEVIFGLFRSNTVFKKGVFFVGQEKSALFGRECLPVSGSNDIAVPFTK